MTQADLLVTVHSGAQRVLGIIGMNYLYPIQADEFLEGKEEGLISFSFDDIEPGSVDMAGIQADPIIPGVAALADYIPHLFQTAAQLTSGPRHGFQKNFGIWGHPLWPRPDQSPGRSI